ncbi:MAG: hypothetical protein QOF53_3212 [Nocardioidaceae bacterium]|nr:hypothetical protein [Nocardioidaceae bacterium]
MNTFDLELLSQSWAEPELARVVSDFVRTNGRLPQRPELLETLVAHELLTRLEPELSSGPA